MDLLRHPRVGAWAVADDRDSADYEKRNLLATVENLRAELLARDALVESLQQEINMLHSIKRTSPVAVVPKQKNGLARKLQLDDLPDGLLLRVFTHMDKLFLANVMSDVCQRWRGLAREPSLWCDVQLTYSNPKGISSRARIFRRVLEVAPAVDTLEWGFSEADPPALRHAVETCTTEATHLCINLDSAAPDAVLRLLWNSRRVLTVFCLREGPLSSSFFSASQASRFWEMIEAASQLQSLVLFLSQRSGLASCVHAFKAQPPRRSSLRTLFVDVGVLDVDYTHGELGVTLQLLIRAHQHTLVDVHLPMRVGTPGALLAASRCPALRVLSTQATADVKTLKNTPSLRELRLTVGKPLMSHYYLLQDVARLEHLTKLRLVQLPPRTDDDLGVSAGLLAVLTPQSALRELALTYLPPAAALDRLCVPPMAAPHLQELKVKQSCGDAADGACRLPAVRRLVLCRPGLHVVLESVAVSDQCCDYHRDLEALRPDLPLTFVGHPRDDCCLERLKAAGTVLLLAPEEVRHTRWCEVAADGTDIPCRPHGHTEAASPASPEESTPVPKESTPVPKESTPVPKRSTTVPAESTTLPKESTTVPKESTTLPEESTPLPEEATPLPEESTPLPEESTPLPENVPVSPDAPPSPSSTTTCLKHVCGPIMVSIPLRKVNFSVGAGSAVNSTANANVPMAADSIQHVSGAAHSCGEAPIDALIQGRIDAPVDSYMDIPVDTFVDNPVDDPVHTPMDIPFDSLVEVSVQTPLSTSIALWNGAPCEGHLESATEAAADAPLEAPTQHPTCGPVGVWNGVPLETSMQETADRTSVLQPSRRNSTRSCRRASYRDCYNYPGDQYAFTRKMKVGKVVSTSRRPKAPKARVRSLSGSPCLPSSTESCPATPEPVAPTLNLNAATPEPLDQQQPATLSPSSRGVFFGFKNETPSSGHSPSDRQGSTPSPSLEALEAGSGPSSSYTVVGRAVASLLCTVLPPIPPFDGVPSGAARASWQRDAEGHAVEAAYQKTDGAGCALCPHTPLWCSHRDGVRCQPSTGPSHDDDMELE